MAVSNADAVTRPFVPAKSPTHSNPVNSTEMDMITSHGISVRRDARAPAKSYLVRPVIDASEFDRQLADCDVETLESLLEAFGGDGSELPLDITIRESPTASRAGGPNEIVMGMRLSGGVERLAPA
jgi:hypothetical protein